MQKLEFIPIIAPEGFFVSDVKLTKAGIQKLDSFMSDFYDWLQYPIKDAVFDIECDALNMESEPMCVITANRSITDQTESLHFVRDIDFTVEMTSFQADELARLARNLNDLHNTMQEEMNRLGW